jgi:hypothetical protein
MQNSTAKRARGRPPSSAPPRPPLNIRLAPELRSELEQDARRAKSSIRKEIETRLRRSYLRDAVYCDPQMAVMFREMAQVAESIKNEKGQSSFFEDLEVFADTRKIWDDIILRNMPPPSDEQITKLRRDWDAVKTGARRSLIRWATGGGLTQGTPPTLAEVLAGAFEPIASKPAGIGEGAIAKSAASSVLPEAGGIQTSPADESGAVFPEDKTVPLMAEIVAPLLQRYPGAFAVGDLGSLARVMEALRPSGGTLRGAAKEVSRLVEVLAEAMEEAAASETSDPVREADAGGATARK